MHIGHNFIPVGLNDSGISCINLNGNLITYIKYTNWQAELQHSKKIIVPPEWNLISHIAKSCLVKDCQTNMVKNYIRLINNLIAI